MRLPQSSQRPNEAQPEPDADLSKVWQHVLRHNGCFALAVKTKHRFLQALTDWRSFRAQLVALEQTNSALTAELSTAPEASSVWVHELSLPEKGCLLLGRMESMGQFTNAVILLCQHGMWCCAVAEQAVSPLSTSLMLQLVKQTCLQMSIFSTDSLGSSGFIINMPLPQKLLDLSTEVALAGMFALSIFPVPNIRCALCYMKADGVRRRVTRQGSLLWRSLQQRYGQCGA